MVTLIPAAYRSMVMSWVTFFIVFKNQNATTNDAVKQAIEAVNEFWLKWGIPMKNTGLPHSGKVLDFFCCPGKPLKIL